MHNAPSSSEVAITILLSKEGKRSRDSDPDQGCRLAQGRDKATVLDGGKERMIRHKSLPRPSLGQITASAKTKGHAAAHD